MKAGTLFAVAGWAVVATAALIGYRNLAAHERATRPDPSQGPLPPPKRDAAPRPALRAVPPTPQRPARLRLVSGQRPIGNSPKARHHDYAPRPFHYEQHDPGGGVRLVAWTGDLDHQRETLATLVHLLAPRVEVLTKVMRDDEHEAALADSWVRFYGIAPAPALLEAIRRCEAFVFRDSRTQICARNPWTMEYIVLDHDGCLYVYSTDPRFRDALVALGFEPRVESLISSRAHWRQLPPEGPAQQHQFVRLLRLSQLRAAGEPTPAHEVH